MLIVLALVLLAVSASIVAMPPQARDTLTDAIGRFHDQAASSGVPAVILRVLDRPDRVIAGLRLVGVLYAAAAVALLAYALT